MKKFCVWLTAAALIFNPVSPVYNQTAVSPRDLSREGQDPQALREQVVELAGRQRLLYAQMRDRLKSIEDQHPELVVYYREQLLRLHEAKSLMKDAAELLEQQDLVNGFAAQAQFFQEAVYVFVEGINYFRDEKEAKSMPIGTFLDREGEQVSYPKEKKMTIGRKPFFESQKFEKQKVVTHSYKEYQDTEPDEDTHLEAQEHRQPRKFHQKPESDPVEKSPGVEEGGSAGGGIEARKSPRTEPAERKELGASRAKRPGKKKFNTIQKTGGEMPEDVDRHPKTGKVKEGGGGAGAGAGAGGMRSNEPRAGKDGGRAAASGSGAAGAAAGAGDASAGSGHVQNGPRKTQLKFPPSSRADERPVYSAPVMPENLFAKKDVQSGHGIGLVQTRSDPTASNRQSGMAAGASQAEGASAASGSENSAAKEKNVVIASLPAGQAGSPAVLRNVAQHAQYHSVGAIPATAGRHELPLRAVVVQYPAATDSLHGATRQSQITEIASSQKTLLAMTSQGIPRTPGDTSGEVKNLGSSGDTSGNADAGAGSGNSAGTAGAQAGNSAGVSRLLNSGAGASSGSSLAARANSSGNASSGLANTESGGVKQTTGTDRDGAASAASGVTDSASSGSGNVPVGSGNAGASASQGAGAESRTSAVEEKSIVIASLPGRQAGSPAVLRTALQHDQYHSVGAIHELPLRAVVAQYTTAADSLNGTTREYQRTEIAPVSDEQGLSSRRPRKAAVEIALSQKTIGLPLAMTNQGIPRTPGNTSGEVKNLGSSGDTSGNAGASASQGAGAGSLNSAANKSSQIEKQKVSVVQTSGDSRGPERRYPLGSGAGSSGNAGASGNQGTLPVPLKTEQNSEPQKEFRSPPGQRTQGPKVPLTETPALSGPVLQTAGKQPVPNLPQAVKPEDQSGSGPEGMPPLGTAQATHTAPPRTNGIGAVPGREETQTSAREIRTETQTPHKKDDLVPEDRSVAAIREWLVQERLLIQELKKFKPVKQLNNPNPPWEFYLLRQRQLLDQLRQIRRRIEFYGKKDEYFMELRKLSRIANRLLDLLNAGEFTEYQISGTSLDDLIEQTASIQPASNPVPEPAPGYQAAQEEDLPEEYREVTAKYFERLSEN